LIFKWLSDHLGGLYLDEINRDLLERIADIKEKSGSQAATINRMLQAIRSIMRKAQLEWEWLDKIPSFRMRREPKGVVRWITHEQATRLIAALPQHLADMAAFSLATGLRKSNLVNLKWKSIDMMRRHAFIAAHESKTKKPIPVPLNSEAMQVLERQKGKNRDYVFTYKGNPVTEVNTRAWRKALVRAGIKDFRWHDLRHTWASWHVHSGTSLHELQQLGGWTSYEMVLRYAHLSSDQLKGAAERICGPKSVQGENNERA
jgi:integrase